MLGEKIIIERDPVPGVDLHLAASQCREAVGKANVGGLGVADTLVDVISDRKEDQNPQQE